MNEEIVSDNDVILFSVCNNSADEYDHFSETCFMCSITNNEQMYVVEINKTSSNIRSREKTEFSHFVMDGVHCFFSLYSMMKQRIVEINDWLNLCIQVFMYIQYILSFICLRISAYS